MCRFEIGGERERGEREERERERERGEREREREEINNFLQKLTHAYFTYIRSRAPTGREKERGGRRGEGEIDVQTNNI